MSRDVLDMIDHAVRAWGTGGADAMRWSPEEPAPPPTPEEIQAAAETMQAALERLAAAGRVLVEQFAARVMPAFTALAQTYAALGEQIERAHDANTAKARMAAQRQLLHGRGRRW